MAHNYLHIVHVDVSLQPATWQLTISQKNSKNADAYTMAINELDNNSIDKET